MPFGATAAEIICDGVNGFLTQNNKEAMAAKIRQIISNRQILKDVGHIASKTVANSWEHIIGTVQQRYISLMRKS
jgi:glycosyltransferase involved in cell wall biosynthesis